MQQFEKYQELLRIYAKNVSALPYDPELHLARGTVLMKLQYPELAAVDTYKALLLCEAGLNPTGCGRLGELVRIHHGMSYWLENQGLVCF